MDNAELEKILEQPIYATDFQYLIGDIEGFLDISETNIERLHRQELFRIRRMANNGELPDGDQNHLEENANHRFAVSLPLQVRYSGLIALCTSLELFVKAVVPPDVV